MLQAFSAAEKTKKETYYLHPDGKGEPGKERNWPQDKSMVDLPWYAMSFVLDGQRFTCCYLNHPQNPKDTRFSERDYGRFGGYFEATITEDRPLMVNYRDCYAQTAESLDEIVAWMLKTYAPRPAGSRLPVRNHRLGRLGFGPVRGPRARTCTEPAPEPSCRRRC